MNALWTLVEAAVLQPTSTLVEGNGMVCTWLSSASNPNLGNQPP